jgi:hypothetical protein
MIFRDISRLKRLEEVRREFVANVSHELRTPLSIFHGYLENLVDTPEMSREQQAEIFAIMEKHSQRLHALLEDLLILARLESRHDELHCEEIALAAFIQSVCDDWKAKIKKKQIRLSVDLPPNLPPLAADPMRLEQVLNNLLENALKYTEAEWGNPHPGRRARRRNRAARRRHGHRHSARGSASHLRAVLPRRQSALPRTGRHRPRPLHRQTHRAIARRQRGRPEQIRLRHRDHPHLAARRRGSGGGGSSSAVPTTITAFAARRGSS